MIRQTAKFQHSHTETKTHIYQVHGSSLWCHFVLFLLNNTEITDTKTRHKKSAYSRLGQFGLLLLTSIALKKSRGCIMKTIRKKQLIYHSSRKFTFLYRYRSSSRVRPSWIMWHLSRLAHPFIQWFSKRSDRQGGRTGTLDTRHGLQTNTHARTRARVSSSQLLFTQTWSHSRRSSNVIGRVTHDDTFWDAFDRISFTIESRIKQVIRRLLKWCQHQHLCHYAPPPRKKSCMVIKIKVRLDTPSFKPIQKAFLPNLSFSPHRSGWFPALRLCNTWYLLITSCVADRPWARESPLCRKFLWWYSSGLPRCPG